VTEEHHNIPPWFMPSEDTVLIGEPRGEVEKEHFEDTGQLLKQAEENLCPHCGKPYKLEDDGNFIHEHRVPTGTFGLNTGLPEKDGHTVEPTAWCTESGEKRYAYKESFGYKGWQF